MGGRGPHFMTTLQGTSLVLAAWFALSFVGVSGFVMPRTPNDGAWFWLSALLWLHLPVIYALDFFRVRYAKWIAFVIGLTWLVVQYLSHWRGLLFPGTPEQVTQYYARYDTLYLFGPFDDRVAPDFYHVFLDFMILVLVWIALKRILLRTYQ